MLRFIAHRLLLAIVTVWAVSVAAFLIIQLPPGDFVDAYIANERFSGGVVSAAEAEVLRSEYGLDQSVVVQYVRWVGHLVTGNFGNSLLYRQPVQNVIADRLSLTVILALAAIVITWIVALPIGIYSAVRQYSVGDYFLTILGFIGLALPNFLLALIVMYVAFKIFGVNVGGLLSDQYLEAEWSGGRVWDLLKHLPVPALILGAEGMAQTIRIMRANLLDELRKPYVTTARAKGLSETRLILKYPVRVALSPLISTIGYLFPYVISGSVIVSVVMGLPTLGPVLLQALVGQDLFLAGTIVMMLGILTVIGTLISDLLLLWVDPRLRASMDVS
jgi:peptide/nickel transport system permease protein